MFSQRPRRDLAARNRRAALRPATEALEGRQLLSYSPIGSLPDLDGDRPGRGDRRLRRPDQRDARRPQPRGQLADRAPEPPAGRDQHGRRRAEPRRRLPAAHAARPPGRRRLGARRRGRRSPAVPQNSLVTVSQTLTLPGQAAQVPRQRRAASTWRSGPTTCTRPATSTAPTTSARSCRSRSRPPCPTSPRSRSTCRPSCSRATSIAPTIKVANYGTVDTATQGPVTVLLVASTDTELRADRRDPRPLRDQRPARPVAGPAAADGPRRRHARRPAQRHHPEPPRPASSRTSPCRPARAATSSASSSTR